LIRQRHASGETLSALAAAFSVTPVAILKIVRRQTWRHIQ
jgi:hypothetical protein